MKIMHTAQVRCFFLFLVAVLSANLGVVTLAVAQERPYLIDLNTRTLTELGSFGGITEADAINESGQVVGWSYYSGAEGHHEAFITGPGGIGMISLGTLGGVNSRAHDINSAGQVAGWAENGAGDLRAFITDPKGKGMTDLGTFGGDYSFATGINDAGQVVGQSVTASEADIVVTGSNGEGWNTPVTGGVGASFRINDSGQAVGVFNSHAFVTGPDGIGITDLGTLGGSYSEGHGINDAGQVAGLSYTAMSDSYQHAFITGPNGEGMTDLGTLGGRASEATGINNEGRVVGGSTTGAEGGWHAFITGPNGEGMTDLNSLVDWPDRVLLIRAVDINDAGQVLAIAQVPELEACAMILAGLGLIGFVVWRERLVAEKRPEVQRYFHSF